MSNIPVSRSYDRFTPLTSLEIGQSSASLNGGTLSSTYAKSYPSNASFVDSSSNSLFPSFLSLASRNSVASLSLADIGNALTSSARVVFEGRDGREQDSDSEARKGVLNKGWNAVVGAWSYIRNAIPLSSSQDSAQDSSHGKAEPQEEDDDYKEDSTTEAIWKTLGGKHSRQNASE